MTPTGKFLFDECLGRPSMEQLKALVPGKPEFAHLCDYFKQGTGDDVWIPKIATEGGWVLITSDTGRQSGIGPKLPKLCLEHKVTYLLLSKTVHRLRAHEKVAAMASVWEQISLLPQKKPGSRFKLKYNSTRTGLSIALIEIEIATQS